MVGTPTGDAINLALKSLHDASANWDTAKDNLTAARDLISTVGLSQDYEFYFTELYNRYKDVPGHVYKLLDDGQGVANAIAATLEWAHDTYQKEEQQNLHSFKNLY
ncbi:hypothetical protein [Nocardia sp. CDC160]|uniref:hypothetical protein n=1 Tax=Nocardia sp. CDC160 TaxID=3112166 RepID=UPI002DBBCE8F|nr:hypothetical protein [Nocardia sp. CDC160]MEC3916023.1 hypothetical protein [Nocardia sp. CDC160]